MKLNKKGFTLAELLIVVAIIAVLVGVAIPVFTSHLEKSKEAVDLTNVRSAYSKVKIAAINEDTDSVYYADGMYSLSVPLQQTKDGWTTNDGNITIGELSSSDVGHWIGTPGKDGNCVVYCDAETLSTFIDWSGSTEVSQEMTVDYNSVQSVGKYIYNETQKQLEKFKLAENEDSDYNKLFANQTLSVSKTLTLGNGQEVKVVIYNRNYNSFEDIKTRLSTANTASLIYNNSTRKLSTIIYYDGTSYSSWTIEEDDSLWSNDDYWKENEYR